VYIGAYPRYARCKAKNNVITKPGAKTQST
jgi:hypothetical protein